MERFSSKFKLSVGSKPIADKIGSIAEHAATVSIDWLNTKRGYFWDISKKDQHDLINKYLNTFIRKYKEDIEEILDDIIIEEFVKKYRNDIVKNIRKFMYSVYGD